MPRRKAAATKSDLPAETRVTRRSLRGDAPVVAVVDIPEEKNTNPPKTKRYETC